MPLTEEDQASGLDVELQFLGYYEEKNVKFSIDMTELATHGSIVYEMTFEPLVGEWKDI